MKETRNIRLDKRWDNRCDNTWDNMWDNKWNNTWNDTWNTEYVRRGRCIPWVCRHNMTALSILPLSRLVAANSINPYSDLKSFEWLRVQDLSESIYNHVFCWYVSNNNLFRLNLFLDPVMSYFNIFSAPMKFWICCKQDGSSVVGS